jgi:hypothetical protein
LIAYNYSILNLPAAAELHLKKDVESIPYTQTNPGKFILFIYLFLSSAIQQLRMRTGCIQLVSLTFKVNQTRALEVGIQC